MATATASLSSVATTAVLPVLPAARLPSPFVQIAFAGLSAFGIFGNLLALFILQPETRLHVAVPGHQRFNRAHRQGDIHVRQHQVALHQEDRLIVPDRHPVAVLRAELWVRGSHDGRRTLAGAHQTVFLQKDAYFIFSRRCCCTQS